MQIVSLGDNLHEMSNFLFYRKKKISSICSLLNMPIAWYVLIIAPDKGRI